MRFANNKVFFQKLRFFATEPNYQATTHNGMAVEWLWMNYPPPLELHDYRYLGDNSKERERIKLKTARWVAGLKRMPALERNALLSAINENF